MGRARRQLQAAWLRRESAAAALANLERLREAGTVDAGHYQELSEGYRREEAAATAEVDALRNALEQQAVALDGDLTAFDAERSKLDVRRQVGELTPDQAARQAAAIDRRRERLRSERDECRRLAASRGSRDPAFGAAAIRAVGAAHVSPWSAMLPAPAEITALTGVETMTTPASKAFGLAAGNLLLVASLLPWLRNSAFGEITVSGGDLSLWLLLVALAGFAGTVWAALLEAPGARAFLYLASGSLGLLTLVIVLTAYATVEVRFDTGIAGLAVLLPGAAQYHVGPYLFFAAAACLLGLGIRQRRNQG